MRREGYSLPLIACLCLALLLGGLVLDLATEQALVVAIVYDIPVALSGLARSRRLTLSAIVIALANNLLAAYANAAAHGTPDGVALLNRSFSGLSVLLVGVLTLALHHSAARVTSLSQEEERGRLERDLRRLSTELCTAPGPDAFLQRTAQGLQRLLEAEAVTITALKDDRLSEPHYAAPEGSALAPPGDSVAWALDALPRSGVSVVTLRDARGPLTVGKFTLSGNRDFLVLTGRAKRGEASHLLGEALLTLTPLLQQSERLEQLKAQLAAASTRGS